MCSELACGNGENHGSIKKIQTFGDLYRLGEYFCQPSGGNTCSKSVSKSFWRWDLAALATAVQRSMTSAKGRNKNLSNSLEFRTLQVPDKRCRRKKNGRYTCNGNPHNDGKCVWECVRVCGGLGFRVKNKSHYYCQVHFSTCNVLSGRMKALLQAIQCSTHSCRSDLAREIPSQFSHGNPCAQTETINYL